MDRGHPVRQLAQQALADPLENSGFALPRSGGQDVRDPSAPGIDRSPYSPRFDFCSKEN
jgi:hypothetical protein